MKARILKKRLTRKKREKQLKVKRAKDSHLANGPYTYYKRLFGTKLSMAAFYELQREHYTYYYMGMPIAGS